MFFILQRLEKVAEYWKSNAKFWCRFCKIYITDNKSTRNIHDSGTKHKENVERFLREQNQRGRDKEAETAKMNKQMEAIEKAAMRQYQLDVEAGLVSPSGTSSASTKGTKTPPAKVTPEQKPTPSASLLSSSSAGTKGAATGSNTEPVVAPVAKAEVAIPSTPTNAKDETVGQPGEWQTVEVPAPRLAQEDKGKNADGKEGGNHYVPGADDDDGEADPEDLHGFRIMEKTYPVEPKMDDFYQFMSPLEGATNNANDRPSTKPSEPKDESSASTSSPTSSRTSWSTWGASFNKLVERGKKDMNEFVDVTRKDLTELVQTVQQERSTAMESLTKKVEDLKTTLPPIPASVNTASADIFGRVSSVVGGIKQEITDAATVISSNTATEPGANALESVEGSPDEREVKSGDNKDTDDSKATTSEEHTSVDSTNDVDASTDTKPTTTTRGEKTASLSFASTASLFTAGATTLTQTLSSSTKDISITANELFKKKLPAVAEKHLGEADVFLKSTTESLKSNGLLAEQYVNKLGANMANFLNSAVVISAPEKEVATRSKKVFFDRKAAMLEKLRMDPETYTIDPMTTIADNDVIGLERYKYFLQNFNIGEYQQRNTRMLNEYPEMKALMMKLVPIEVTDEELFWLRYYFRLFEIEEEEKRRKKLVQEAGADISEEDFTWDDNDDDEEEGESSAGQGSVTPKAEKKSSDAVTPRASQILSGSQTSVKREPLTAEALASSLSALPIPDENTAGSDDGAKAGLASDDEWGSESLKSTSSPSINTSAKLPTGTHSKSPTTNMSSTRTSEDAYEVVDGVETPVRVPLASVTSMSSAASSPALEQPIQQPGSKLKPADSKEEDDWSDWE
ncbi:hypothetical protein BGX27_006422 [Mortierella sp. AM989]|nr:hypothetical protein BGX27_006422 [Mortierella sp. AM989]